jgi:two-component system CheB/CheR fusion protein
VDQFRNRVKIYATDVDEDALNVARQANYSARAIAPVPEEWRERYFEPVNGSYAFRKDLRRTVIFGRHDLLHDAPISRVDLLVCRNTLMYLNSETQGRVLSRFFFALNNQGYLFLGKAETLFSHTSMLTPVDLKLRIFQKVSRVKLANGAAPIAPGNGDETAPPAAGQVRMREQAFELDPVAQITVDANGAVGAVNARARETFGLTLADVGRPLQDLEVSYRPVELRSMIEQATSERRTIVLREVEWGPAGDRRWMDVHVIPLPDGAAGTVGVKLVFDDVSRFKELQQQLHQSRNDLETAYEELQSSNEELETTNEELQSTVEELETTNEELQSTNEELETMNEELQSTNEELETVNTEMRERGNQVNEVNAFLEAVLSSLRSAVVVIDPELSVQAWNQRAEDLWGLRAAEVTGKHFLNLDIGLPVDQLKQSIRDCLAETAPYVETALAVNRRGRQVECRVTCSPLRNGGTMMGVIIMMEADELAAR